MKLFKSRIEKEPTIEKIDFNIFKLNNRSKPEDDRNVVVICSFSEFGCETLACNYVIPKIIQDHLGKYIIVVGWYGREYLYRHLVDEFWEIKEEHQWLRDYGNAYDHKSKNISNLEDNISKKYLTYKTITLGNFVAGYRCNACRHMWGSSDVVTKCPACESTNLLKPIFNTIGESKKTIKKIPLPSKDKIDLAKSYLKKNPVGIFARGRKTYGRNLPPDFYKKLIFLLRDKGYEPIWLGEKQSTLSCPVEDVLDFTRNPEARDLELTLAIISQLAFTIQFWTASTRLAAITGTPYILFESPGQLVGGGQEGMRLALTTFGKRKIVYGDFIDVSNNLDGALSYAGLAIDQLMAGDCSDIIGLVENKKVVENMIANYNNSTRK